MGAAVAGFPGYGRWIAGGLGALVFACGVGSAVLATQLRETPAALRYVSGAEPETLDPAFATAQTEVRLLDALFEGLFRIDPSTLRPEPAAAERVAIEAGGRRTVITLRAGLRWSDGRALEASDFLYAWRRVADPRTGAPLQAQARAVAAHARARDRRTIVIELAHPRPSLPALLTLPCFLPVPERQIAAFGRSWTRPGRLVSNGPFRLVRWDPGRGLRLVRNRFYGRPVRLPSIEAVTINGAALGEATALRLYLAGEVDLLFGVPASARAWLRGRPDFEAGARLGTVFLRLNRARPLSGGGERETVFADVRVRRALALALDREALVRGALRGAARATRVLVPAGLGGYRSPPGQREDAATARALLAAVRREGRLKGPLRFELLYAASDENARHGVEVLQARWREVLDAEVVLRPTERKVYFQTMRRRDYDMAWGSWLADYPDPENFLSIFHSQSGNNRCGFADRRFDALLAKAARTPEPEVRLAVLREAEARLLAEAPCVPLYHTERAWLRHPGLEGLIANPMHVVRWERVGWRGGARP